ncbi:right-handed parallel beta-helix repeat-containing protein [Cohnella sp. WQ 127256]|uniref:right-handed parallel beta-helix repeat-containing protein n=1 Tax=Cohnella sp. WQ 127256 TaxID=2938790 RepID=UPI002119116A|nr:right-handed parallel beta-helix repeat-containing protein [Cohnella sp. WQ 127256]
MHGVWEAASFGIEPNTGVDMTGAIRSFVQEGLAKGIHTFQFKKGIYEIADVNAIRDFDSYMGGVGSWDLGENTDLKHIFIQVEGLECITLDFQGALLRFHGLIQPFSFIGCKEVNIRNAQLDWARPLFSQAEVTAVDEDGFELLFDDSYPIRSGVPLAAMIDYVPGSAHPLRGTIDWFHFAESSELVGPQRLRVKLKDRVLARKQSGLAAVPLPGMHVVVRHIMNYKAAFLFYECDRVVLDRVTIYTTPGMGVVGHRCGDVFMHSLRVMRRPGSEHILSTNTDATHFIGCTGHIDFEDCLFEGMGDDATNVHGFYLSVRDIRENGTLLCGVDVDTQSEFPEHPVVGDVLEFTRRSTLKPYATLTVQKAVVLISGEVELEFQEKLPPDFSREDLLANASRIATLRFCNSIVRNNRARAILVQTRGVEITGNTFDHCTGTAIHVNCADGWKESIATADVTISDNLFLSCGMAAATMRQASALALMTESAGAEKGVHRRFTFTNNVVYGNGHRGITVDSLSGGLIRGNRYYHVAEEVHIVADNCEELIVE